MPTASNPNIGVVPTASNPNQKRTCTQSVAAHYISYYEQCVTSGILPVQYNQGLLAQFAQSCVGCNSVRASDVMTACNVWAQKWDHLL